MQPAQIFILDLIQLSEYPDRLQNEEFVSVYLTFRLLMNWRHTFLKITQKSCD